MRNRMAHVLKTLVLLSAIIALAFSSSGVTRAAQDALNTCLTVLLPTLFPFFVLTRLLVGSGGVQLLGRMCNCIMRPLFGIRGEGAAAFVMGLLSGYPVGAKTAADLYRQGLVSRTEAQNLLGFCNNCGPLFVIGAVGSGMLGDRRIGFYLLAVHIAAAITVGMLSRIFIQNLTITTPKSNQKATKTDLFTQAVESSVQAVLTVFGYVIFFAVLMGLLSQYGILSLAGRLLSPLNLPESLTSALLYGFFELMGGIQKTTESLNVSLPFQLVFISFFLGWAGWSVHLQAKGFISGCGLSFRRYVAAKLTHGGIAAVYTAFTCHFVTPSVSAPVSVPALSTGSCSPMLSGFMLLSVIILAMYLIRSRGSATRSWW